MAKSQISIDFDKWLAGYTGSCGDNHALFQAFCAGYEAAQQSVQKVNLEAVRQAVAEYMYSEGCSCCRDIDAHKVNKKRLAKLLNVPLHSDGSGYDFSLFRLSASQQSVQATAATPRKIGAKSKSKVARKSRRAFK